MSNNSNLHKAKKAKNDEFYTQYKDVENELRHYKHHLKGKVIYCNCDRPVSNFVKYFIDNFHDLGLKELIFTHHEDPTSTVSTYNGVTVIKSSLTGNGSFKSNECIALLQKADIVITNPPFSLFTEYFAQLIKYNKKFLIIGNKNAVARRNIFPLIKDEKVWMGISRPNQFIKPNKEITTNMSGLCRWFTNLGCPRYNEDLMLYKRYTPGNYPKYDNYGAINIDKTKEIPKDYSGLMGVPITFLDKYNPDQFEMIDVGRSLVKDGKKLYNRILIKKK